jgi:sugar phosphate permease
MQNWTAPGKRGFAQGITHAFARLGNAVAPPIVAFLIYQFGWRLGFVILGVASFAWVVVWYLYFRDDPKDHPAITPEELAQCRAIDPKFDAGLEALAPDPWIDRLYELLRRDNENRR